MRFIKLNVLSALYWRDFDLQSLLALYALGYAVAWISFHVGPASAWRWRSARPGLAILPPLLSMTLMSAWYVCPVCHSSRYRPWCELAFTGIPFPARVAPRDVPDWGPRNYETDQCGEWSFSSYDAPPRNAATAGNALVGLAAMPAVFGYFGRRARKNKRS